MPICPKSRSRKCQSAAKAVRRGEARYAAIGRDGSEDGFVYTVRLVAEDELPAVIDEHLRQKLMHVLAVGAEMDAMRIALEQGTKRRERVLA